MFKFANYISNMEYGDCIYFIAFALGLLAFLIYKKQTDRRSNINVLDLRVIETREECLEACSLLLLHCRDLPALGFDCEWRPCTSGASRPVVSLLQLASPYGLCCLFRLNILSSIPDELAKILMHRRIFKFGVTPLQDSHYVEEQYGVPVRSTIDLRHLFPFTGGLSGLSGQVLGIPLNKYWQCSDWEADVLTPGQQVYAAKDALVAIEIFKKWLLTQSSKPLPLSLSLEEQVKVCQEVLIMANSELHLYVDCAFKPQTTKLGDIRPTKNKANYATRQSPLYHNCFMHAPDGQLLCSCDRRPKSENSLFRKAEWYVEKGLAEVMQGEPFSIRLLFEPAARATDENGGRYYQQLKQNCCVVCGSSNSYLKHHVIPREYRKHFPALMKDHQSHDIVLMCTRCHHLAGLYNETLRKKLEITCNAPIKVSQVTLNKSIVKLKNCAKALLTSGDVIPQERKTQLENEVKDFYKVEELTEDLLKSALSLNEKSTDEDYQPHGLKVVNYYRENDGLLAFEKMWRQHFLQSMDPKYLPALWSVTHNHERVAAKLNNEASESIIA